MIDKLIEYLPHEAVKMIIIAVSILTLLAITVVLDYMAKLRGLLVEKIGKEKFAKMYEIAKRIYFIVEEKYELSGKNLAKQETFDKIFKEYVPKINDKELNHLRESVVGELKRRK